MCTTTYNKNLNVISKVWDAHSSGETLGETDNVVWNSKHKCIILKQNLREEFPFKERGWVDTFCITYRNTATIHGPEKVCRVHLSLQYLPG